MADGDDEGDWTPADVSAMISNPFYAIEFDSALSEPHEPMVSEDEWVAANIQLIRELGPEPYLRNLLAILKGDTP